MDNGYLWLIGFVVFCFTMIVLRILDNRRQVVRHVLHGTVTYTIKGYDGHRAVEIAQALRDKPEPDPVIVSDELEHRDASTTIIGGKVL